MSFGPLFQSLGRFVWTFRLAIRLGPISIGRYLKYRCLKRCGWYRWRGSANDQLKISEAVFESRKHLFRAPQVECFRERAASDDGQGEKELFEEADLICRDHFLYFSKHWKRRPENWRAHPLTGYLPPLRHWTEVPDFDGQQGDIKWIWEASRFDWVYVLGRAYARHGEARYRERFVFLVRDWWRDNPVNQGVHWRDGQETALRVIALLWAVSVFRLNENDERFLHHLLLHFLKRIDLTLDYALSQRNNHGLSEALALFLGALAMPVCPEAARWQKKARRLFETQILDQFSREGWYAQHSMIYTRFALRLALVYCITARDHHIAIDPRCESRLHAATAMLSKLVHDNGRVPNYGANDGTHFLRLSSAAYFDFRPTVESLHYLFFRKRWCAAAVADEELLWLFGAEALKAEAAVTEEDIKATALSDSAKATLSTKATLVAPESGVFAFQGEDASWGFIRCGRYRHRPSHADALHFDWWYRGENILIDSGTFQYFDEAHWGHYLKSTAAHNTVVINGQSQMREFSRFLWADWLTARGALGRQETSNEGHLFSGSHQGYQRRFGIVHKRSLYYRQEVWMILDDLRISDPRTESLCELRWHFAEATRWQWMGAYGFSESLGLVCEIRGEPGDDFSWKTGTGHYPETGASWAYGEMEPIGLMTVKRVTKKSFRWVTILRPLRKLWTPHEEAWLQTIVKVESNFKRESHP